MANRRLVCRGRGRRTKESSRGALGVQWPDRYGSRQPNLASVRPRRADQRVEACPTLDPP